MISTSRLRFDLLAVAAGLSAATIFPSASASADDKTSCVASYEHSQVLRKDHHLMKAREELKACSRSACPVLVRSDCVTWLDEVQGALPSIAIRASKDGADVASVRVIEDGEMVASKLDGTSIEVEPGEHAFRFETEGAPPISLNLVVHEHEKDRVVPVAFASPHEGGAVPGAESSSTSRPVPVGVWVTGGVGVAGIATFAILGAVGRSDESSLRSSCSPNCSSSAIDKVRGQYIGADVALGVGAASLLAAGVWYLLRPSASERPAPDGAPPAVPVPVALAPRAGGGVFQWTGSF